MKKQTFWKAMRQKDKSVGFEEAQGYVIDLTDNYGYTVKIALEYKRPYWRATHYESGLSITPYRDVKEYPYKSNDYKSKDELIEVLKTVDFGKLIKNDRNKLGNFIQMLNEYKNKN